MTKNYPGTAQVSEKKLYEPEIITKTVNHAFKILKYCLNDFIKVIVKPSQTS